MTGFWLCSTRVSKSLSSWIVTIWFDDVTSLAWRNEADCRITLDDDKRWWFCVERFVDGLHVDNSLTGIHLDLQSSCLPTCSVILDAIAVTKDHQNITVYQFHYNLQTYHISLLQYTTITIIINHFCHCNCLPCRSIHQYYIISQGTARETASRVVKW